MQAAILGGLTDVSEDFIEQTAVNNTDELGNSELSSAVDVANGT